VYVDASQVCSQATFNFGAAAFTRSYDIKVTTDVTDVTDVQM
jgi:hypothetical protein